LLEEQRRLAAILAADVEGYSRLMAADEGCTLGRLRRLRAEVFEPPKIAQFHGRITGSAGDSLLKPRRAKDHPLPDSYSGATGLSGRFTEGFWLRRLHVIEHSVITCPNCGHQATERMPTDACQYFYDCHGCGALKGRHGS
jgi:hypothetical protein